MTQLFVYFRDIADTGNIHPFIIHIKPTNKKMPVYGPVILI